MASIARQGARADWHAAHGAFDPERIERMLLTPRAVIHDRLPEEAPVIPAPVPPTPEDQHATRRAAFDAARAALQVGLYQIDGTELHPDVAETVTRRMLNAYFDRLQAGGTR